MNEAPRDTATRSQRLKIATQDTHAALDAQIMASQPFASRQNYARFLRTQYCFHRDLDAIFASPSLASVVPDLSQRNRMQGVAADLSDLRIPTPELDSGRELPVDIELSTGLGWLYVVEGSKLGAAILFKAAAALGLDELFGARHLAGHPEGRARHWREFTTALDSVSLSASQEQEVIAGARAAFERVRAYADRELAT